MINPAEPDLGRYREMDFDELAGFIRDCLDQMYAPDHEGNRPHSLDEYRAVWRVLSEKADAMPSDPTPPPNALEKAYAKRRRTRRLLDEAPGNPKYGKKDIRQMRETLDRLDREIEKMEASGEYDHRPLAPLSPAMQKKWLARRVVSKTIEDIELAFKHQPKGQRRLQWRPGRSGSITARSIQGQCEETQRANPEFKYDIGRIEKAYALNPDDPPWVGPDGFDGYVIFTFPSSTKALMECPEIGHAAYVIHKDWQEWSWMDKQELMEEAERGGDVTRIPHQGKDWPEKVRQALGLD